MLSYSMLYVLSLSFCLHCLYCSNNSLYLLWMKCLHRWNLFCVVKRIRCDFVFCINAIESMLNKMHFYENELIKQQIKFFKRYSFQKLSYAFWNAVSVKKWWNCYLLSHNQAHTVSLLYDAHKWCSEIIKGTVPLEKPAVKCFAKGNNGEDMPCFLQGSNHQHEV